MARFGPQSTLIRPDSSGNAPRSANVVRPRPKCLSISTDVAPFLVIRFRPIPIIGHVLFKASWACCAPSCFALCRFAYVAQDHASRQGIAACVECAGAWAAASSCVQRLKPAALYCPFALCPQIIIDPAVDATPGDSVPVALPSHTSCCHARAKAGVVQECGSRGAPSSSPNASAQGAVSGRPVRTPWHDSRVPAVHVRARLCDARGCRGHTVPLDVS